MKVTEIALFSMMCFASVANGAADTPLFYCSFDSESKISTPDIGPVGEVSGIVLRDGYLGKALYCQPGSICRAIYTLPAGFLKDQGKIEFWAKLDATKTNIGNAEVLFLLYCNDNKGYMGGMQFTSNNGYGGCGLYGRLDGECGATTSPVGYGGSYSDVLGEKVRDWHHYELLWNVNGVRGCDKKVQSVIKVDGTVVADQIKTPPFGWDSVASSVSNTISQVLYLNIPSPNGEVSSAFYIDEFKVWATDSATGPVSPSIVMPVVSNVTAQQHYPWCGKIDISYEVSGDTEGLLTKVVVKDNQNNVTYDAKTFDVQPTAAVGLHKLVWDATADGVNQMSANMVVTVSLIVPEN